MKKIIAVFFAFTLCCSVSSFASFKEAAELFEQERYIEAYDDFFACYQQNDLRGNAYLRNIIITDKINAERKEFWTSEELQKLEDTTCIRSEKSLKASMLYQDFLKQNNKLAIEKKQNKKKKLEKSLIGIVNKIVELHKESISHATFILIKLAENDEFKRRFKLSALSVYYDYALEWHVDRDIYIDAFQKGYLNRKGYETCKLYAQFLIRFPENGEGELKIATMLKKNESLLGDEKHCKVLYRWFIQAAYLGNQEAIESVSKNLICLIMNKNKLNDASYIRDSSILTCLYKAAYDGLDDGYYACLLGYNFDEQHKKNANSILGIQKSNENAIFWYKKAKEQRDYLGAYNYIVLWCNEYGKNSKKIINVSKLNDFVNIINEILKIENDASDLNSKEYKEELSKKIIYFIEIIYDNNYNFTSLAHALNYVIAHGDIISKNIAERYKATFSKIDFFEEKLTDDDCFQLYLSASETSYLAMLELGCIYEHGLSGQEIDFDKSFACYTKAYNRMSELGLTNYIMYYNLGMSYLNGQGCEKSYVLAYELLNKAYALMPNDPDIVDSMLRCSFFLGEEYNQKAYKFAVLADKMNVPFGDFHYAICLLFGKGCKKDINQGTEIIKNYYDERNAIAAYLLGKIELIESSHDNAQKYFEDFVLWTDPKSELEQSLLVEVTLQLSDNDLNETYVSGDAEKSEQAADNVVLDVDIEKIEGEYDESYIDYQQIIEGERQKSLDKRDLLKNRQQSIEILEEENMLPASIVSLKPKQRQIFDAIMDSSVNQEVKWSQFEKLICGLMKKGDFLKPAGGSKINIKLGQVQKQIHMPEHNEAAPLCPGRIKTARKLLSAIVLEEQTNQH
jgi:TPR repeat protein